MNLIQNNPYRILGVLAGASVREIAKQKNRLQKFLTAEQDPPTDDYSFPALGKLSRTTIAIAKAASKLNLDSDKMTAALFWFWNGNPITDDVAFEALIANNLSNAYDIWQKLTENSEVNKRNASAFQNLSTTMLTAKTGFEKGIHLKLQFLESDLAESFITQVTDETYKTTKKELQLIFLNNLIENIDTQKVVDIIKKTNFSAKVDFLKSVSQKLISKISTEIETAQKKRIANKTNAAQAGEILYNNSKADLEQLKFIETHSYTRINNTQKNKNGIFISGHEEECNYSIYYSNIADKVANEILQCGIDYFNEKHENISNEDIDCVINLVDFAKFIAIGKIMQERIEENRKIITGIKYYNLCYYCGRTIANATSAYKKTIYKETARYDTWNGRKVEYRYTDISIPRCKKCAEIHSSISSLYFWYPFIAFTLTGLLLGSTIWGYWFGCLLGGGVIGYIIGSISKYINNSIITKEANIKKENDIISFPPVRDLLNQGWTFSQPTA